MLCVTTRDGVECNCVTRSEDEESVGSSQPPKDCQPGDTWTSDDFCSSGSCADLGVHGTTWMLASMVCYMECKSTEKPVDIPGQCCGTCAPKTCDASECITP